MPSHCPGCGMKVPTDAQDCPYCPMSFREDEHSSGSHRRAHRPAYVTAAVGAALVAGIGYVGWEILSYVMEHGNAETPFTAPLRTAERIRAGGTGARPGAPEADAGEAADEADSDAKEWTLRGKVYDLETLKPLSDATLAFSDPRGGDRHEADTDGRGAYELVVPALRGRGYTVEIAREGYAASYLNPGTENVPKMSEEDRRQLCAELAGSSDGPYTVQAVGGRALATDFYLAPAARRGR